MPTCQSGLWCAFEGAMWFAVLACWCLYILSRIKWMCEADAEIISFVSSVVWVRTAVCLCVWPGKGGCVYHSLPVCLHSFAVIRILSVFLSVLASHLLFICCCKVCPLQPKPTLPPLWSRFNWTHCGRFDWAVRSNAPDSLSSAQFCLLGKREMLCRKQKLSLSIRKKF